MASVINMRNYSQKWRNNFHLLVYSFIMEGSIRQQNKKMPQLYVLHSFSLSVSHLGLPSQSPPLCLLSPSSLSVSPSLLSPTYVSALCLLALSPLSVSFLCLPSLSPSLYPLSVFFPCLPFLSILYLTSPSPLSVFPLCLLLSTSLSLISSAQDQRYKASVEKRQVCMA